MPAMREVVPTRQVPGEPRRRWFASRELDLIVWYDDAGALRGFQLCYDKGRAEHALTWEPAAGLVHRAVDDGEASAGVRHKATPVLALDAPLDVDSLRERFTAGSAGLPREIVELVVGRLRA